MEIKDYLGKHKKTSRFTKLLWWCAGADRVLLEQSPMKDRVKYAGIGGIVLCTGMLAAFSGGYAFYTIFGPKGEAVHGDAFEWSIAIAPIIFGIVWGMIILNLDRFIVSSTGKGDGTDKITLREFGQALPRIIIALILGIAISAPLEVRILKSEIDAVLQKKQEAYKMELDMQTDSIIDNQIVRYEEKLAVVEGKIKEYDDYVESRRLELKEQFRVLELEAEGKSGSRRSGRGPAWRDKKDNLDYQQAEFEKYIEDKQTEIDNLKAERERNSLEINDLDESRAQKKEKNQEVAHQLDGLLERIHISHEIGGLIPFIILLVLLSIEMGPIFFKMMMTKGVYDYLVENNDKRFKAYSGIIEREEIYEDNEGSKHRKYYEFMEAGQELDEKKMKIQKQNELSQKIVDAWHKEKEGQISDDPSNFYKSTK